MSLIGSTLTINNIVKAFFVHNDSIYITFMHIVSGICLHAETGNDAIKVSRIISLITPSLYLEAINEQ
jgi:hypothetical protein